MAFKELFGEFSGTLIMVFIGCGTVAAAVLWGTFDALWQIALMWGLGVAIAIFATRSISYAHINPAVSMAIWAGGNLKAKQFFFYTIAQLLGAILAGYLVWYVFNDDIMAYEAQLGIVRGSLSSYKSAVMFGEFFPNPGNSTLMNVSVYKAAFMEGLGTFILVFMIFRWSELNSKWHNLVPVLIGLTVSIIIMLVAPYTQAGINPARDLGPRIVAYFAGWKNTAAPSVRYSFLTVYVIAPFIGAIIASQLNKIYFKYF